MKHGWDLLLTTMILYFVVSIINSKAQGHIRRHEQERLDRLREKSVGKKR